MVAAAACLGCGAKAVGVLVDLGPQPPSNRFERVEARPAEVYPLIVGQCSACGLVQLLAPMPPSMAKSRFEWLHTTNPKVISTIWSALRALPRWRLGAYRRRDHKDDTTLARFNGSGTSMPMVAWPLT
jgi:hypothetical protein